MCGKRDDDQKTEQTHGCETVVFQKGLQKGCLNGHARCTRRKVVNGRPALRPPAGSAMKRLQRAAHVDACSVDPKQYLAIYCNF